MIRAKRGAVIDVRDQIERLFREGRRSLITALTRTFGPQNLETIEAALQDAFASAAEAWPASGVPGRPDAWLLIVARNQVITSLRHQRQARHNESALEQWERAQFDDAAAAGEGELVGELGDDDLRMMFVACHPCNSTESQIALALRTLCGMEIDEIARALLSDSQAVAKRLVRARRSIRQAKVAFDLPDNDELSRRLPAVTRVIYLLFNEGYSSLRGDRQIREELCQEATRLGEILAKHHLTASPRMDALVALMFLQSSRFASRTDAQGALLTLAAQDRSKWDRALISRGLWYLQRSAAGDNVSEYHLEATIAMCHATAETFAQTNWPRIVSCYDVLVDAYPSPIAAFNRAVAIGFARGPAEALAILETLSADPALAQYLPYQTAVAEFLAREGRPAAARSAYAAALVLAGTEPERAFIKKRLEQLGP